MTYTAYSPSLSSLWTPDGRPGAMDLRSRWRRLVLPKLDGDVLDVGAGEGHSTGSLPGAARVTSLEPHPGAVSRLRLAAKGRRGARVLQGRAESMPLPDRSMDAAICCVTLCSVDDQDRALAEIHRVLRPGGRLVAFEHVAAPKGTWLRAGQQLVAPFSRVTDRGCHPARDTEAALDRSLLRIEQLVRVDAAGPWGLGIPHLAAVLRRPDHGRSA